MKRPLPLLLLASGLALGLSAPARAANPTSDEAELREIKEVLWPRAYREGDTALLDRLLAEEFRLIDPSGGWSDKATELEHVARGRWVNRAFRFEIRRLEVFENGTAVVAGRGVVIGPESDPDGGYQYQSSNVLIRRAGRWQAIASHVSGVRPLTLEELTVGGAVPAAPRGGCTASPDESAGLLALARSGFSISDSAERQRRALELAHCLGDPDPAIRDGVAFSGLSTWLRAGAIAEPTRLALAERLLPWVEAEEEHAGFRRSFAALTLSEVARADRLAPALPESTRRRLIDAAVHFFATTRDYRGFDAQEGWRHAVAHGADLALQLGLHPATTAAETERLLAALATQIAPTGVSYVYGEPGRLARAVFFLHGRGLLDDAFWDGWFAAVGSPRPLAGGPEAFASVQGLARRHDVESFLHAAAFAARANPGPASDRLADLADRELVRLERGEPEVRMALVDHHVHLIGPDLLRDWKSLGVPFSRRDEVYLSAAGLLGAGAVEPAAVEAVVLVSMAHMYGRSDFRAEMGLRLEEERARVARENDHVAREAARTPGCAVAFCSVAALRPYAEAELDRCHTELGAAGVKLHLAASDVELTDASHLEAIGRILARAEERGQPVLLHVDPQRRGLVADDIARFARTVLEPRRELTLIVAHLGGSGGYGPWTRQVFSTLVDWLEERRAGGDPRPRLFFDTSAVILEEESEGVPPTTPEEAAALGRDLRRAGLERIVLGSDYPVFDPLRTLTLLAARAGLTAEEIATIAANRPVEF